MCPRNLIAQCEEFLDCFACQRSARQPGCGGIRRNDLLKNTLNVVLHREVLPGGGNLDAPPQIRADVNHQPGALARLAGLVVGPLFVVLHWICSFRALCLLTIFHLVVIMADDKNGDKAPARLACVGSQGVSFSSAETLLPGRTSSGWKECANGKVLMPHMWQAGGSRRRGLRGLRDAAGLETHRRR